MAASAAALRSPVAFAETPLIRWRGHALGAEAELTIRHPDRARARRAIEDCVAEIQRIERVFSLYRQDSALSALNTAGALDDPPADLVEVLNFAAFVSRISDGAFDVTVQPLWKSYVRGQRNPALLAAALERARPLIGWQRLSIGRDRLAFDQPHMAATLNGIAQGHATDRVAGGLRQHGFEHVLVNLGELHALGNRVSGEPWRIGVGWPDRKGLATVLALSDRAVATSSPLATPFNANANNHHLFDPRTGHAARGWTSVSVIAPSAMQADALSTAITVAPKTAAETILETGGGLEAVLIDDDHRVVRIRA
jgi:thiamine biosynthesis lipoprotein